MSSEKTILPFYERSVGNISLSDLAARRRSNQVLLKCIDSDPLHNLGAGCNTKAWFGREKATSLMAQDPPRWAMFLDPEVELEKVDTQLRE